MSQINLDNLSVEQLASIQKDAQALIKSKQKEQIGEAYVQFQQIAKSLGVTVEEIVKAGKGVKNKRPAKYQNPADKSQTWSGQGRKPQWLVAALEKGKKLEDFLL